MGCLCAKNTKEEPNKERNILKIQMSSILGDSHVVLLGLDGDQTMYSSDLAPTVQSDPASRLVVKVQTMSMNAVEVQVKTGATTTELKRTAAQAASFLTDDFWLICDGKVLDDNRTLASYGYSNSLTLTAISKLPKIPIGNPFIRQEERTQVFSISNRQQTLKVEDTKDFLGDTIVIGMPTRPIHFTVS